MKASGLLAAILCIAACGRGIQNEEAVRQGVIDYLASRSNLNVSAMNVAVSSVSFRKDEADAMVSFTARGGDPAKGIQMRYILTRKGDRWVVKDRTDAAGSPHGQANPHAGSNPAQ